MTDNIGESQSPTTAAPSAGMGNSPLYTGPKNLTPDHYAMLHTDSAIADEVITSRGYCSLAHPDDLRDLGFSKTQARTAPALAIPLWDVHGQQTGWQIRP